MGLMGLAQAEEFLTLNRQHPVVGASAHVVKLDQPINTDGDEYVGQIYIGEDYSRVKVLFDTMSKWTFVIDNHADGDRRGINSAYEVRGSDTKEIVADENGFPMSVKIELPTATLDGSVYREQMCIGQKATDESAGELCVTG